MDVILKEIENALKIRLFYMAIVMCLTCLTFAQLSHCGARQNQSRFAQENQANLVTQSGARF